MKKRIWNQLKKAVMITAAVGILGAGAVSAAEFEVAELYVPAVGLKQSAQWIDEEKFQAELTLEVSGLKELYKSQQENTASENGQLQMDLQFPKRIFMSNVTLTILVSIPNLVQ